MRKMMEMMKVSGVVSYMSLLSEFGSFAPVLRMHAFAPLVLQMNLAIIISLIPLCPSSWPTQRSADRVHGDTEQVLAELQRSVERLQELLEEVLDQAGQEKMGQAQEVVDSLEAEIKEMRRRDTEMKDLARCEDHIHYLQVEVEGECATIRLRNCLAPVSVEILFPT